MLTSPHLTLTSPHPHQHLHLGRRRKRWRSLEGWKVSSSHLERWKFYYRYWGLSRVERPQLNISICKYSWQRFPVHLFVPWLTVLAWDHQTRPDLARPTSHKHRLHWATWVTNIVIDIKSMSASHLWLMAPVTIQSSSRAPTEPACSQEILYMRLLNACIYW